MRFFIHEVTRHHGGTGHWNVDDEKVAGSEEPGMYSAVREKE